MPVKRSRIGRSSSSGETEFFNHLSSPPDLSTNRRREIRTPAPSASSSMPSNNPSKVLKPSVPENTIQPPRRVLTLSSPDQDSAEGTDQERIHVFLEKCYYCGRRIRANAEVYMYSYLRAFCTAECRDIQISLDKDAENQSGKSENMVGQSAGMNQR